MYFMYIHNDGVIEMNWIKFIGLLIIYGHVRLQFKNVSSSSDSLKSLIHSYWNASISNLAT